MQIFPANLVIGSDNATLEDRPKAFDCVGVDCADNMLSDSMVYRLVREATLQAHIAGISICTQQADAVRYSFTDESLRDNRLFI
jgi:hypothetical protein